MIPLKTSRRSALGWFAAGAAAATLPAFAQTRRALRVILPVSAGSGIDTIIRSASLALGEKFGQPVVVENLPGAGGITGASALLRAAPDGNTVGFVSNNHVINAAVYKKMPFDAVEDFTPITVLGDSQLVLLVTPRLPARNVQQLIALLKEKPAGYNYASSGNGTVIQLATEMFLEQSGTSARHIPYRGVGPMVNDLIAGQVDFGVVNMSAAAPHIHSSALQALGVCGRARSPIEPGIATVAEQGLPDYAIEGWYAFIGPPKLPAAEIQRLQGAIVRAFGHPDVQRT